MVKTIKRTIRRRSRSRTIRRRSRSRTIRRRSRSRTIRRRSRSRTIRRRSRSRIRSRLRSRRSRRSVKRITVSPKLSPFRPTLSTKFKPCIRNCRTTLRDVQIKTVEHFNKSDSLLVIHGTGMGKTLTALTASQCFISENVNNHVVVVTAASLVDNFKGAFKQYGEVDKSKYEIYNFDRFMNKYKRGNIDCCDKDTMLIVDEVHILKNYESVKFEAVMACAQNCKKVLLLTATPYVNSVCDFIGPVNLLHRDYVLAPKKLKLYDTDPPIYQAKDTTKMPGCSLSISKTSKERAMAQMAIVSSFLKGRVSYAEKPVGGDYPAYKIHKEIIPMSKSYQNAFLKAVSNESDIFGNPSAFYNGYRRAVNDIGIKNIYNDKLKYMDKILKKNSVGNVIFSNWLEFGVNVIRDYLAEKGLSYSVISGETPIRDRKIYVDRYNKGDISTLVISTAGATGIDLKGTQKLFVMDPVWNSALLDQIVGRAVRYRSHVHLPKQFQKVDIYFLLLVEREYASGVQKGSRSGDFLLYDIIEKKRAFNSLIEKSLKKLSIV